MDKILVEYSSNNSGGGWWLSDEDWKNLEKAGWDVEWGGKEWHRSQYERKKPRSKDCGIKKCPGHKVFNSWEEMKDGDRCLGALAKEATKEFDSLEEGIDEWEKITGQSASDKGCNCCGAPHSFSGGEKYVSGDNLIQGVYELKGKT